MTVHNMEKIEDILEKYMWEFSSYTTNKAIYNDILIELPALKSININLHNVIQIEDWVKFVTEADIKNKIENRNKAINIIINE